MPAIFYHRHQVLPEEIDGNGHVNNLRYLQWCVDAAVAHSAAQGWDRDRYRASGGTWVVRSHNIEYLAPCYEGQHVVVATWVVGFRRIRSNRRYQIHLEENHAPMAKAETWWAFVAIPSMAPRRVPEELQNAFDVVSGQPTLEWETPSGG